MMRLPRPARGILFANLSLPEELYSHAAARICDQCRKRLID